MTLVRTFLSILPGAVRHKLLASFIQKLVTMSAALGARALKGKAVPRILIDNCVLRHGLTHSNAWVSTGTKLWGDSIPVETGYSARVPVDYGFHNRGIFEEEVPYFAPLAKLAVDERICLFTSVELRKERLRQPSYDRYRFGMNLWSKVVIDVLPDLPRTGHISYSLGINELREHWSHEGQVSHLLATADVDFQKIAKHLPRKHILDFYHIWTAKQSGCSIFLTTDSEIKRVFDNNLSKKLRDAFAPVRILKPSDLGKELGLIPISHDLLTPLECDWAYEFVKAEVVDKQMSKQNPPAESGSSNQG